MCWFYEKGEGLATPSKKIEFFSSSLHKYSPEDRERPPVPHYIPCWEGLRSEPAKQFPLQTITPHPRFDFHTHNDAHSSWLWEIPGHRILKNGYSWWPIGIHPSDATVRRIQDRDIAHLLDRGWKETRCVEACPTLALRFGDIDAPEGEISRIRTSQETEVLQPQFKTRPKVSYIGVPKLFIAGSVVFADTDECGVDTYVSLLDPSGREIRSQQANGFGDFEFERIEDSGLYQLKVWAAGYEKKILSVDLKEDTYLGEIVLRRI